MALPTIGQLSMNDIRGELNRSTTTNFSLDGAESGTYGSINTQSSSRPNNARPAAISEWRGYDHDAGPSLTRYFVGYDRFNGQNACNFANSRTVYGDGNTLQTATRIYQDSTGTLNAIVGWYNEAFEFVGTGSIARFWNGFSFSSSQFCRSGGSGEQL